MNGEYSYSQWIDHLFYKSTLAGVPLSGTFELTARCNLDCKMCYIHKRENDRTVMEQELSTGEWLSLAQQAQKRQMLLLLLTGGEPLLRKDFREIYTGCRKLGLLVSINTNGTLIDEDMVEFFRKDPPIRMNITLYGASRETYKSLCGDEYAYDRAYGAVLALKKAGIRMKINYSATPWNAHDLPEMYRFAKEHDLTLQTASYMFPPVRACELGACQTQKRLTPEESAKIRWEYEQFRFPEEALAQRTESMLAGLRVKDALECQELPTERIRCRAGSTTFWVTYDGQMRPCGMLEKPTIKMTGNDFDEAWAYTRKERENIMLPAKCTACKWKEICEFCPAVTYAETGHFEEAPEYICKKTEAFLELGANWLTHRSEEPES